MTLNASIIFNNRMQRHFDGCQGFAGRWLEKPTMSRQHDDVSARRRPLQGATRASCGALIAACALLMSPAARAQTTPTPTEIPAAQPSPVASGTSSGGASGTPAAKASDKPDPQTSCPPGEHYVKAYTTRRGHLVPANCKKDEPKN